MKKFLTAAAGGLIIILGACGGGGDEEDSAGDGGGESYDEAAAEEAFQGNCAQCHGENLEGGSGPALEGEGLSQDEVLSMIEEGGSGMPSGIVEGQEAENVAQWVSEKSE
ncbi:c-type cytochrome [Alteribacillus sp. HJP-4]|uniref:c-type cytochrome n=1 Tax=Alteribacillus sp. HJP-4 TaxID=2775394 RepID=UPI0035CD1E1F